MKLHNGTHPRRQKAARKASRKLKTIAGRLVRELLRKLDSEALAYYGQSLNLFESVLAQKVIQNKRYSLHEPAVVYSERKPHKKYEFGCKVSVARNAKVELLSG